MNKPDVKLMLELCKENESVDLNFIKKGLAEINMKSFYDLCHEHEMDGIVAANIMQYELQELPDYWMKEYIHQQEIHDYFREKAKKICSEMKKNNIKLVVLKNGGIMVDMIDDSAKCPMEDVDTLVKQSDFKKAHQILVKNGFEFKFRSVYEEEELEKAYRDGSTEYFIDMPNGEKMWFELAWRAVAGRWIRLDKEPHCDNLVDDAYYSEGTDVGILSPEDNLLQVCVHTAKHSYVRAPGLRLHLDVERIVTLKQIDWELFLKKVCDSHVKCASYFSLYFAKILFNTGIPEFVLEKLNPGAYKKKMILSMISDAGLLHPKQRKFSKIQFLRFQTMLYDSFADFYKVANPGFEKMKELYGFKNPILMPYYIVLRNLDLVGIRKKYKK